MDLTGDRLLTLSEARKLKTWWLTQLWHVELIKVHRNRFRVIATK